MARIAIVTPEVLGPRMAGPAIRAWHMARALEPEHEVVLVAPTVGGPPAGPVRVAEPARAIGPSFGSSFDVAIVQADVLTRHPAIARSDAMVVADLFDPYQLEALERTRHLEAGRRRRELWAAARAIDELVRRGDVFLCASAKQRDFWIGHLAQAGRVNERTYDASPDLSALIAVVPFGVEDRLPAPGEPAMRGVVPGIGAHDRIVMWGGGIYQWLDAPTVIRAVAALARDLHDVRLVFAGARHPNPTVGETPAATEAMGLAERLGLLGRHVFFNDWVPYEQRGRYLLEADVVVSAHREHLETAFSFRTRLLDSLWAGRPVVATGGDDLAQEIEAAGAGLTVPPGDVGAFGDALRALLTDVEIRAACGAAARRFAARYAWPVVLGPLVEVCRAPRRAPDLVDPQLAPLLARPGGAVRTPLRARIVEAVARSRARTRGGLDAP